MRPMLWCGILLLAAAPARAEAPPKVIKETWDVAYIEGARCGYYHATVHELERDSKKVFRTTLEMNLLIKRYKEVVRLRLETTADETPEGKVVGLTLTQFTDKGRFTLTGTVNGDKLTLTAPGDPTGKTIPWNDKVVGPYWQDRVLGERKVKAEDKLEFLSFEPTLLAAVTVRASVKPDEVVDLFETKKDGEKFIVERVTKKLLRVETQPDKVMIEGKLVPLPKLVLWVDKDYATARSQIMLPGLGKMTLYRTTMEVAKQEGAAPALMPDLGLSTLIPVAQAVENIHAKSQAVYRITIKDDDEPATTFVQDTRQEVKNPKDTSFELHVRAVREPKKIEEPGKVGEEFLQSSYFIDSDNEIVKALAAKAVGGETAAWKKAQLIEAWVHNNMKGSNAVGFATAGQIAKDLTGDCRQHAMLTAAMCRAAGLPSRTAVGLVYVRDEKGPLLAFHMWTEVWVQGQWLGLDATLGAGSVGPGHLKIADHSWHNTQTLAPLLPVLRVMGQAKVEVLLVK